MASVRRMTGVVSALASAGMALGGVTGISTAAQAAPVVAAVVAPSCLEVTPTSMSGKVDDVEGFPRVSFVGALANGTPEGSCVKIPVHVDLDPLALGAYSAKDPDGNTVGTMIVERKVITFLFDHSYTGDRTNITFNGAVTFGVTTHYGAEGMPYSFDWLLPGDTSTPVTFGVAGRLPAGTANASSGKFARITPNEQQVVSGVTLGTELSRTIPAGSKVVISDELGDGQKCNNGTLSNQLTGAKTSVTCENDRFISAEIPDFVPGMSFRLQVYADITDRSLVEYEDTGKIHAAGEELKSWTKAAKWASGTAGVTGELPTGGDSTDSTPSGEPSTPPVVPPPPGPVVVPAPVAPVPTPRETVSVPAPKPAPAPAPAPEPAPAPAPEPVPAPKPVPVKESIPRPTVKPSPASRPKTVSRTFQVDRYTPRTHAAARVVGRLDDDRRLTYREDKPLWGMSKWEIVTIQVPADATTAQVMQALNKATGKVGDVRTTSRLGSIKRGQSVTMAWELGRGATASAPWGPRGKVAQTFFARS
ncbi:MAG: hypothetical protein Q4G51_02425 [Dermatophilus congolensis]|nr:hypothetical protein [Dermatophilus congolensis]